MNEVFADTSYFVALLFPRDQYKNSALRASEIYREYHLVTTEMVLVELFAATSRQGQRIRRMVVDYLSALRNDPKVTIIPQTSVQFEAAARYFAQRPDQRYSLTDCASFLVMEERGIERALTFDMDFRSAGFIPLMA